MIKPRGIQTAPNEKHKSLLFKNDEPNHQQNPLKADIHDLHFFVKNDPQDNVWIDVCRPLKVTIPHLGTVKRFCPC